jgi:hypothetical protein
MSVGPSTASDPAAGAAAAQAISTRLRLLADGLDAAATALPGGTSGWSGSAAMAAGHLLASRPERFRAAAVACRGAAIALSRHVEALGPAAALSRQSTQAPAELAALLEQRAIALVDDSARLTAGTLLRLAASAPPRPEGWRRGLDRVDQWRAEVLLGAAESTEALAGTALKIVARVTNPFHRRSPEDVRRVRDVLTKAADNPVDLGTDVGKAVLDWDTWRKNPVRAVGHLVPDAVAAVASAGTAAGARATTMANQGRGALRVAAARDSLRREATGAAASAAREALIRRAEDEALARIKAGGGRVSATAWHGEGGARLSAFQNAGVEAYHSMSTARERSLTTIMQEVSRLGRGELTGLDHRLKTPESSKRKVATEHARTGGPLPALLAEAEDAVRYSVVLTDANYVRGVAEIAGALERQGFHACRPHNAWHGPRYRGINSVWVDPTSGAAFEVQFHTPASYRITKRTHQMYEEFRLPGTAPERKAELHHLIAAEYQRAPIPGWVAALKGKNWPPPSVPDPIMPPADYSVHAAAVGATISHLGVAEPRARQDGGTP